MKKILNYILFNESLRDKMTPIPKGDIKNKIGHLSNVKIFMLMWKSLWSEDIDTIKEFISNGADINITDVDKNTLLHIACIRRPIMVKMLLSLGINPNTKNKEGCTPIVLATKNRNIESVKLILKSENFKPFEFGQIYTCIDLVKNRYDADSKELYNLLVDYELNQPFNESVRDKMTPKSRDNIKKYTDKLGSQEKLFRGCKDGLKWLVDEVIEEGQDVHVLDDSALRIACKYGNADIVDMLIKMGANVNTFMGMALKTAVESGNIDVVKLLMEAGADLNLRGTDKLLLLARNYKNKDIYNLLIKYNKTNESVRDFMKPKSKEELREYIEKLLPGEKLRKGLEYGILSKEEARDMISRLDPEFKLFYGKKFDLLSPREIHELFLKLPLYDKIVFMHKNCHLYDSEKLKKEFESASKDEKDRIIQYGVSSWLITDSWRNYNSDTGRKEAFNTMLKKLRKSSSRGIKVQKKRRGLFFTNESIKDKMTPKSEEESMELLKPILLDLFDKDKIEFEMKDPSDTWILGVKFVISLQKKFGDHYILNYIFDEDYQTIPYIKDFVQNWISKNYPQWNESDISAFWDGFSYSGIYESVKDKMTPISKDQIRNRFDKFHPVDAIIKGIQNNLPWLVDEMIQDMTSKHGKETTAAILQNLGPYHLERAMELNSLEILEILLKSGYKVNTDRMKWAVVNGSLEAIKMLVKYGGVVDSYVINHCERYRPHTSYSTKEDVLGFLKKTHGLGDSIKKFFRTNESVKDKMTPKSHDDIVKSFDNHSDWTKLSKAIENGVGWMVEEMLKNPKNHILLKYLNPTPVMQCLLRNDLEIMKMILDAGYKPFANFDTYVISPEMMELINKYITV